MNDLLLLISILPVILINKYIYNKDREKEPKKLLKKLTIGGVLSCFGVFIISVFLPLISPIFGVEDTSTLSNFELAINVFVGVALVEEFCKYVFVYWFSYNQREFDYIFDMIVYAVYVSLGFALFENILYVATGGISTGIIRAFTAIPMHASMGVLMGHFLGEAKYNELNKKSGLSYKLLALLVPTLVHGAYDYAAFQGNLLLLIVILIVFIITSIVIVNNKSKNDVKIQRKNAYCTVCGTKVIGDYCIKCGSKTE